MRILFMGTPNFAVNSLAAHYNGGGHVNAAGVKGLDTAKLNKLISELRNLIS